jgi:hypothetical protein
MLFSQRQKATRRAGDVVRRLNAEIEAYLTKILASFSSEMTIVCSNSDDQKRLGPTLQTAPDA